VFSGAELTPAQDRAMSRATNDLGFVFAPITGSIFALGYCVVFFGAAAAVRFGQERSRP